MISRDKKGGDRAAQKKERLGGREKLCRAHFTERKKAMNYSTNLNTKLRERSNWYKE